MLPVLLLVGSPRADAADVDLFAPAASLSRLHGTVQGEAPAVRGGGLAFGVVGAWIADPVLEGGNTAVERLVPVHVQASYAPSSRLRIDADFPVYADTQISFVERSGPALGDAVLGALWTVAGDDDGPIALGVLPRLVLGVGDAGALVSSGWGGGTTLSVGGRAGRAGWVVNGGIDVARASPLGGEPVGVGLAAHSVAGAWVHLAEPLRLGAEVEARFGGVSSNARDGSASVSAQGFAQVASGQGLGVMIGGGTGLLSDVGTPRFRLFAALSWTAWRSDRDGDELADRHDSCPEAPEDDDGFEDDDGCPDLDNDRDVLADVDDACPDEPEDVDAWDDEDGCPDPDNDEDGVLDESDECPTVPGRDVHAGCPDRDGDGIRDLDDTCPDGAGREVDEGCPDSDDDGLHDGIDGCPDDPRPADELRQTTDGCPRSVYVTSTTIVTPGIPFPEGSEDITSSTASTLEQVATRLIANPDLGRVEIQGHTDNVGPNSYNRRLSQRRADAVLAYLVGRGVREDRLLAVGYGETHPRFTNRTEGGRSRNRRVQFVLLDAPAPVIDDRDGSTSP